MLFKVIEGKDIFELNEELRAIKEFDLTSMQMTFVALYSDYESPIRTLPDKARREQACKIAGYPMEGDRLARNARDIVAGTVKSIEAGIEKYKELQYDENKALLDAYNQQIQEIMELMTMDKTKLAKDDPKLAMDLSEKATKLSVRLPEIKKAKKKLQELINAGNNEPELKSYITPESLPQEDNQQLSMIDQVMAKKQEQE